jgi:Lon protease-like protein
MNPEFMPLFPLEVVLFPGMALPLHIFEPRYKEMIGRCLEEGREFGVVLARKGSLARVGCSAEIVRVVKRYADGRLDIATVGRRRIEIVELNDELAYLQGWVKERLDAPGEEESPESSEELRALYEEVLRLLAGREAPVQEELKDEEMSYQVAGVLPLDLAYKQQLLELDSEAARRESLLDHLRQWAERLRLAEKAKTLAGGNGRGWS